RASSCLRQRENGRDGLGVAQPRIRLRAKALPALRRELVVARSPIVLGGPPLCAQPAASFHALECLVERTVVDAERPFGALLEPRRDGVAVRGTPAQRLEDEEIE